MKLHTMVEFDRQERAIIEGVLMATNLDLDGALLRLYRKCVSADPLVAFSGAMLADCIVELARMKHEVDVPMQARLKQVAELVADGVAMAISAEVRNGRAAANI